MRVPACRKRSCSRHSTGSRLPGGECVEVSEEFGSVGVESDVVQGSGRGRRGSRSHVWYWGAREVHRAGVVVEDDLDGVGVVDFGRAVGERDGDGGDVGLLVAFKGRDAFGDPVGGHFWLVGLEVDDEVGRRQFRQRAANADGSRLAIFGDHDGVGAGLSCDVGQVFVVTGDPDAGIVGVVEGFAGGFDRVREDGASGFGQQEFFRQAGRMPTSRDDN